MADLDPDTLALSTAVEAIIRINPKRIEKAQAGNADSAYVGIPWRLMVELVERIETARPGWIDSARTLMAEQKAARKSPTPEGAP